jgi:hypothetical protein
MTEKSLLQVPPELTIIFGDDGFGVYDLRTTGGPYIEPPAPDTQPPAAPALTLYSQRDERWRYTYYAGGETFGSAGCYTVAVAMMLSLAGYTDTPPVVAEKLRAAGCYVGAMLAHPDRIPNAYPLMRYDGPVDVSKDGPLRWHDGGADIARFNEELAKGPIIAEFDFIPATAEFNQHFVVALRYTDDGKDLVIADPWDGTETRLMLRYAQSSWELKRALFGVRLLRVK